jgi:adenylate kinase
MADLGAKLEQAIEQAASQYYRLVILAGAPGSGKTTVLQTVGQKNGWQLVNVNLALSKKMLE